MLFALAGCQSAEQASPDPLVPPPEGVRGEALTAPRTYLSTLTELTPPLRLNTDAKRTLTTRVYYRVPEGARIAWTPDGLRFPPGTVAERVDTWGAGPKAKILDIRGTRLGPDGSPEFHAFRPRADGTLYGVHWDGAAHERLGPKAARHLAAVTGADAAKLMGKNDCAGCHEPGQPEAPNKVVYRATDASGFYVAQYVLQNEAPLEAYHDVDPNEGASHVQVTCPDGSAATWQDGHARCTDGDGRRVIPRGRYDLKGALAAGDARAQAVCRSRRYLYDRLDEAGRRRFADAMATCETAP